jgi:putative transposase
MVNDKDNADTRQARWARFRFSIIGPLLSAPPEVGGLQAALSELSKKQWRHPISGLPMNVGVSTIERWLYQVRHESDPVHALRTKRRTDAGTTRELSAVLKIVIQQQYRAHPSWSYQLHTDNLVIRVQENPELEPMPSYNTIRRYMKSNGLYKRRTIKQRQTEGAIKAQERLETREVRSFEVDYVHGLWHLDFHHGSRKILDKKGQWRKPLLLAILDDHSRLICHAQWYFDEEVDSLVHGFKQALQKRGLPRALMSDNGSAMTSAEFTEGLERLGILHQPTLPYSPYQNAKQEVLWAQVEGRLMAMLEGELNLTLSMLNTATLAWVEQEYHQTLHSEIDDTPLNRYLKSPDVGRKCPDATTLKQAFCAQVNRILRKSDSTLSIAGRRFEVSSHYRHLEKLTVRYARWDLSFALLIDPHTNSCLERLYPQDKSANASGLRRTLEPKNEPFITPEPEGIAPLLKKLMADFAATGLPPAYLPQQEKS